MAKAKKVKPPADGMLQLQKNLIDQLNKGAKHKIAFDLSSDDDVSSIVTSFVSTGCWILDRAISNLRDEGGLPESRIVDISGEYSAGKSLLVGAMAREAQLAGGMAIIIDTERSIDKFFLQNILGIDLEKLILVQTKSLEVAFGVISQAAETYKVKERSGPLVIAIDSMPGLMSNRMLALSDEDDFNAIMMYEAKKLGVLLNRSVNTISDQKICMVCLGQARDNIGGFSFGPKKKSTSGNQLKHFTSVAVWLKRVGQIKNSNKDVLGVWVEAQIQKSNISPPFKRVQFPIFFSRGIDNCLAELKYIETNGLCVKSGQTMTLTLAEESHKVTSRSWPDFYKQNQEAIRNLILDNLVTRQVEDPSLDVVEEDEEDGS